MTKNKCRDRSYGFTLFELMVVMGVVAVIAVLAVPAFNSVQRSSALTRGEEEVLGELNLARQHALSVNRDVEVRFYRYKDGVVPGNPSQFRSVQSFVYSDSGEASPIRMMRNLPPTVVIDAGTVLSSILVPARRKNWLGSDIQPPLPGLNKDYEAYAFRFRPDGGTDLAPFPGTPWFITLHDRAAGDSLSAPPDNYTSIVVDPINGQPSSYRP